MIAVRFTKRLTNGFRSQCPADICRLQTVACRLQTTDYRLQTEHSQSSSQSLRAFWSAPRQLQNDPDTGRIFSQPPLISENREHLRDVEKDDKNASKP